MVIGILLFALSGIVKASGDICSFRFYSSIFRKCNFFDPQESWKNKYKSDLKTPKFFGSTTFFVIFTDWFHLHRAIDILLILSTFLIIDMPESFTNRIICLSLFWIVRNTVFKVFFKYIFVKR